MVMRKEGSILKSVKEDACITKIPKQHTTSRYQITKEDFLVTVAFL